MPDGQKQRKGGGSPNDPGAGPGGGPTSPKVDRPNTDDIMKKMRKVDPDQARKYRQRTGQ